LTLSPSMFNGIERSGDPRYDRRSEGVLDILTLGKSGLSKAPLGSPARSPIVLAKTALSLGSLPTGAWHVMRKTRFINDNNGFLVFFIAFYALAEGNTRGFVPFRMA